MYNRLSISHLKTKKAVDKKCREVRKLRSKDIMQHFR